MIAAFLAGSADYPGRWDRSRGDDPDPWAIWVLRVGCLAVAAFWCAVLWHAWEMLP